MVTDPLLTGVDHPPLLECPFLQLTIDAVESKSAQHATWTSGDGRYRAVYTARVNGQAVTPFYSAMRRYTDGFGRESWQHAVPLGTAPKKAAKKRLKAGLGALQYTSLVSAFQALTRRAIEDTVDDEFQRDLAKITGKAHARLKTELERKLAWEQKKTKDASENTKSKAAAPAKGSALKKRAVSPARGTARKKSKRVKSAATPARKTLARKPAKKRAVKNRPKAAPRKATKKRKAGK